jgi:hypothetical protein
VKKIIRVPVVYNNTPFTPIKLTRAIRLVESGKAKWRWNNKLRIRYLKLLYKPSRNETPQIILGFDPGTCFDGISIVSPKTHYINVELLHYKGSYNSKTYSVENLISKALQKKSMYRRTRRSRLRHRKIRFDFRTKTDRMSPTIRCMLDYRKWIVEKLLRLYPVTEVVYEWVNCRNNTKQCYFTQVHQGQRQFFRFLQSKISNVSISKGYITARSRKAMFNGVDYKNSDKSSKSFTAHCFDSFILAVSKLKKMFNIGVNGKNINVCTRFIKKIKYNYRELIRLKNKIRSSCEYFRLLKGGKIQYIYKYSKLKKIRVKPKGIHSNHPKKWEYLYTEELECFKKFITNYGGTCQYGISKFMRLRNTNTGEVIVNKNKSQFEKISRISYKILEFKRQNVEIFIR